MNHEQRQALGRAMAEKGVKYAVAPVEWLARLKEDTALLRAAEGLDEASGKFLDRFTYDVNDEGFEVKSIILAASPSPIVRMTFTARDESGAVCVCPAVMPPTYQETGDQGKRLGSFLDERLAAVGVKIRRVRDTFPQKLLTARSGLGFFGRNGISYIPGFGSYFDLNTFGADAYCEDAEWHETRLPETCETCGLCEKLCPTGAIKTLPIRASRCLTYYNENPSEPMPAWMPASAHNCVVGCMACQRDCPMNAEVRDFHIDVDAFTEEETRAILNADTTGETPPQTALDKLATVGIVFDDYIRAMLPRNLRLLL